jgi:hypothetical protein
MSAVKKESWSKVRKHGRDRFLIKSVGLYAGSCAVAFVLVEGVLALLDRPLGSAWEAVVTWALVSLSLGVGLGLREWNQNEKDYGKSDSETQSS